LDRHRLWCSCSSTSPLMPHCASLFWSIPVGSWCPLAMSPYRLYPPVIIYGKGICRSFSYHKNNMRIHWFVISSLRKIPFADTSQLHMIYIYIVG
jgi:hypothetical protein